MSEIFENALNPTKIVTKSMLNQSIGELQNINPFYWLNGKNYL